MMTPVALKGVPVEPAPAKLVMKSGSAETVD